MSRLDVHLPFLPYQMVAIWPAGTVHAPCSRAHGTAAAGGRGPDLVVALDALVALVAWVALVAALGATLRWEAAVFWGAARIAVLTTVFEAEVFAEELFEAEVFEAELLAAACFVARAACGQK